MNKKFHLIASALALAAAGNANATLILPETGASELLFVLGYTGGDAAVFTQDLGVTIDGFNPNANGSWSLQTNINQLNSVVAGSGLGAGYDFNSDQSNWGWMVVGGGYNAVANSGRLLVTTANPDIFSEANSVVFTAGETINTGWKPTGSPTDGNRLNEAGTHRTATDGSHWALFPATPTPAQQTIFEFTGSRYLSLSDTAAIDGTITSYLFSGTINDTAPPGTNLSASVLHPGVWSLNFTAAGGTLTYTVTAVPVPAAAWLFGSAIAGMIGISRRRRG